MGLYWLPEKVQASQLRGLVVAKKTPECPVTFGRVLVWFSGWYWVTSSKIMSLKDNLKLRAWHKCFLSFLINKMKNHLKVGGCLYMVIN